MLRWALLLSAYNYTLKYRAGVQNANTDGLSRLPIGARSEDISQVSASVCMMELAKSPVTEKEVRTATRTDPVLGLVLNRILEGWREERGTPDAVLKPYYMRRMELTTEGGCVMWGGRVVIHIIKRKAVLEELHDVHPGMCRMKALARSFVWWPELDVDIE